MLSDKAPCSKQAKSSKPHLQTNVQNVRFKQNFICLPFYTITSLHTLNKPEAQDATYQNDIWKRDCKQTFICLSIFFKTTTTTTTIATATATTTAKPLSQFFGISYMNPYLTFSSIKGHP